MIVLYIVNCGHSICCDLYTSNNSLILKIVVKKCFWGFINVTGLLYTFYLFHKIESSKNKPFHQLKD